MLIFSADTLDFLIRDIFLEEEMIHFFSGNLSTGTDRAINFDLAKCITKNKYTYTIMERWRESFHQKGKTYHQDVFAWCIQGRLKLLNVI